jgi:hypothetical protein
VAISRSSRTCDGGCAGSTSRRLVSLILRSQRAASLVLQTVQHNRSFVADNAELTAPMIAYPSKGKLVTRSNWHRLSELYAFEHQEDTSRDLRFICNQIVHSYVFMAHFDDTGLLQGIMFCSDRQRDKRLFHVGLTDVVELFEIVGNDYPDRATSKWSNDKKDYEVVCE